MKNPVYINSIASISPLGTSREEIWNNYKTDKHFISKHDFSGTEAFAAFLSSDLKETLANLRNSDSRFKGLDNSVLFSIFSARSAFKKAGWAKNNSIGINIGSSRGATQLFEKHHKEFIENGKVEVLASPSTTLGNISSWVAQDLRTSGPDISHSVTCSTGLHAVLNGVVWLQSGFADKFIVGGSEAALTPFTIAQMNAMKIYASEDLDFPCQALNMEKKRNSMVLGEAAGVACISNSAENSIAKISGIGYATEELKHPVSISANGTCFQKSMKMAIGELALSEIDAVVMHAPGTIKGDEAELYAINAIFGKELPAITSNKWKIGHTFGASGILSMELAILMLQHDEFVPVPFSALSKAPKRLKNILVNAVGFGGNAVSILINNS
ncbi:3-oxoacyl-(acyl-carrier-protein) synthase [Gillisia sp. Hel_I_86]|uniref:beta-ketoacyl synthase N-terminal-like domain-containing protein n=1 Tax=Gillisia sp. Hel_I_86 TaxID=1249981 RepID=UPI0011993B31|nr:beta-ketoacyl synthase N-terminal-like domain-containing protein [Gillisia sp. Hel_I_86]TVZ26485.1 3-oxoacyl-(acyl-carrier-protein) synthase [Gillisia sp. Hel_I_86]